MFGGRGTDGAASNDLLVLRLTEDRNSGRAKFKIEKPSLKGKPPPCRYMHTIDYVSQIGLVAIYGGRDDARTKQPIIDDLWVIKLHSMEYLEV